MSASPTTDALTDRRLRIIIDDRPGDPFFQVALEEAVLRTDSNEPVFPTLRLWRCGESVVMGYGRRVGEDVRLEAVEADGIPLLRRSSGGGTVYHHPDNICYSFYLPYAWPELRPRSAIADSIGLLCGIVVSAIQKTGFSAEISNVSDIMISGRKFSGTAQQRLKRSMCHHGTILLEGHEGEMDRYLKVPPERRRGHRGFVVGLRELGFKKERADIYSVICDSACEALNLEPVARSLTGEETGRAERLEREKYRKREFIFRFE